MKHLPPDQFEKAYVQRVLLLLLFFILFAIISVILLIPDLEVPWMFPVMTGGISALSLFLAWVIIFKYRHRMKNLYQEILELDFKRFTDGKTPYLINWSIHDQDQKLSSGSEIIFSDLGITCDDHHIPWKNAISFEAKLFEDGWKASLSYLDQGKTYQLAFFIDNLGVKIIEYYTHITINTEKLKIAEEETYHMIQSEIVWGTNLLLWAERIGFILMVSITGIGGGVLLGLYVMQMEFAILFANLFIIPIVLIVYPKRYNHYPSYSYWMNKHIIGYAKGKKVMVIPFEKVESMSFDEKRLYLNLKEQDEQGDPLIVYIPRDQYLIDRLSEHMKRYEIDLTLIKL